MSINYNYIRQVAIEYCRMTGGDVDEVCEKLKGLAEAHPSDWIIRWMSPEFFSHDGENGSV